MNNNKYILVIDIASSKVSSFIASKKPNGSADIIGYSSIPSAGIRKGLITNIKTASEAIQKSANDAMNMASVQIDIATVSISNACCKGFKSSAIRNIVDKDISIQDIKKLVGASVSNAKIPENYETIQSIPYNFKVDNHNEVEDPNGMSGSRLEIDTYIITAESSAIENLRKVITSAGFKVHNFVLDSYASSISVLDNENPQSSNIVIDLGANISSISIHKSNSVCHSDYICVGSWNITNDLSLVLNIPLSITEEIKKEYSSILPIEEDEVVKTPYTHNITRNRVIEIVYARVEETIMKLSHIMKNEKWQNKITSDIILTGGMSKIEGIKELAESIFGMQVKIKHPIIKNHTSLEDAVYSTVNGLILYETSIFNKYEIDYSGNMKYKVADIVNDNVTNKENKVNKVNAKNKKDNDFENLSNILEDASNSKENDINIALNEGLSDSSNKSISNKVIDWFKSSF